MIADYSKRNESCCAAPCNGARRSVRGNRQRARGRFRRSAVKSARSGIAPVRQSLSAEGVCQSAARAANSRHGILGQIDWNLGFAKLTSITAWRDNTIVSGNDVDYTGDRHPVRARHRGQSDRLQAIQRRTALGRQDRTARLVGGRILRERNPDQQHGHLCRQDPSICICAAGCRSASVGPAELSLDSGIHRKTAGRHVHPGRIRRTAIFIARPPRAMRSLPTRPTTSRRAWI